MFKQSLIGFPTLTLHSLATFVKSSSILKKAEPQVLFCWGDILQLAFDVIELDKVLQKRYSEL